MVKKITKIKVVEMYLNDYGKRHYLREAASLLGKPHQSVKPYVEELAKEGILIKIKRKNLVEYSLNLRNGKVYDYLVIAEKERLMEKLRESTILNILYEKLSAYFEKNIFIIFGSCAGQFKKGSDVDLLVIGRGNISGEIENFEEVYNQKIHKVQVTCVDKLSPALIKEVYKKHLIFNNTEEIIRFFGSLYEKNKLV